VIESLLELVGLVWNPSDYERCDEGLEHDEPLTAGCLAAVRPSPRLRITSNSCLARITTSRKGVPSVGSWPYGQVPPGREPPTVLFARRGAGRGLHVLLVGLVSCFQWRYPPVRWIRPWLRLRLGCPLPFRAV
jgi:hypothetical protein